MVGAGPTSAAIHSHAQYRLESLRHFRLSRDRSGRQRSRRASTPTPALARFAGYYFIDDYRLDNPYPGGQGGASIPGFDALTIGRAQMLTLGDTKVLGPTIVNEFHAGFLRNVNDIGQPHGGLGVSLQSQGFVTGPGTAGIVVQAPQFEGVENIVFPSFVMGVPITNTYQWNNTLYLSDSFSKVMGTHTLKFGGQFHNDQVNENPNATFNGTFNFRWHRDRQSVRRFSARVPSNFTQTTGQRFYLRNRYVGAFVEDSWRARSNLTVQPGLALGSDRGRGTRNTTTSRPLFRASNRSCIPTRYRDSWCPAIRAFLPLSPRPTITILLRRLGVAYSPNFSNGFLKALSAIPEKPVSAPAMESFIPAFPA